MPNGAILGHFRMPTGETFRELVMPKGGHFGNWLCPMGDILEVTRNDNSKTGSRSEKAMGIIFVRLFEGKTMVFTRSLYDRYLLRYGPICVFEFDL